MSDFAHFIEFAFMCTLAFLALCIWTGIIMTFMYGVLRLVFPKKTADATESEAEPGQPKKKFVKKPAAAAVVSEGPEAPMHFDDAEEFDLEDVAPRRSAAAPAPKKAEKPEAAPAAIADRLANDFDAQQVTA